MSSLVDCILANYPALANGECLFDDSGYSMTHTCLVARVGRELDPHYDPAEPFARVYKIVRNGDLPATRDAWRAKGRNILYGDPYIGNYATPELAHKAIYG